MSNRRKPSEIRFSQDSIKSRWKDDSCQIGETLDQLLKGEINVDDIEQITVKIRNGNLYSGDNRRLWVFQKLEKLGKCDAITVKFGYIDPRKFTTTNLGTSVRIRRSEDPGGKIWKFLEKEIVCLTFTAVVDNRSGVEARPSPRANKWTDINLSSAFENTIQIDEMEKNICLSEIGYFQKNPLFDGEYLGKSLDKWLQIDISEYRWKLQVFKRLGRYYTEQCTKLWVLKNLEKFNKWPEVEFTMTDPPFEEKNESIFCLHSVGDSLKTSPIGGSVWKNIDYLKTLTTQETAKSSVSDIYFTMATIPDTYENKSIAKVLADSYAALESPRLIRVVKFGGKYYALDNEILWGVKESQRMIGSLRVSVEVKIEMDQPLFRGFISEKIEQVTIQETNFSHTNEESFIFECMKRIPRT